MFWWADKILVLLAAFAPILDDPSIEAAARELQPSVAYVLDRDRRVGVLALVDDQGTFIGHARLGGSLEIDAGLADGRRIRLRFKADDAVTGLAAWVSQRGAVPGMRPVGIARQTLRPGSLLIGLVPSGAFRAQLASADRLGVVGSSRQVVDLSEVWFEAPSDPVAGALLFTASGQLYGILGATLSSASQGEALRAGDVAKGLGARLPTPPVRLGPSKLTVGFALGREPLRRAVEGLSSPLGRVDRPALGVFCRDDPSGGAVIERVAEGSAAEKAGLAPGDVILQIGDLPVRNQIEFAKAMQAQRIGERVKLKVRRGSLVLEIWAAPERG